MSQATVAISSALNLCISLALASTILYVLLMKEPLITLLITFIAAIVYITINFIFSKRLKLNSRLVKKMIDLQQQITTESLHLHKEIVVGNDYDRFINLFSSSDNQMRTRQAENSFISGFPKYALESAMLVTIVGIAVIQISYNEGSELLLTLGLFAIAVQRIIPSLQTIYASFTNIKSRIYTLQDILNYATLNLGDKSANSFSPRQVITSLPDDTTLELKNVAFSYDSQQNKCFSEINIVIEKSDILCIVDLQVGKSTPWT